MWGFESSIPSHLARSSSGPGHRPLKAEIAGSNPARATNLECASPRRCRRRLCQRARSLATDGSQPPPAVLVQRHPPLRPAERTSAERGGEVSALLRDLRALRGSVPPQICAIRGSRMTAAPGCAGRRGWIFSAKPENGTSSTVLAVSHQDEHAIPSPHERRVARHHAVCPAAASDDTAGAGEPGRPIHRHRPVV